MTKPELIESARRAIELDNVIFNIVGSDSKNIQSWGVEMILNNVIIKLNAIIRPDKNEPDTSISLAYKSERFLNEGKIFHIPVKNEAIEYSLYEELVNIINKKILRTEDEVSHDLKSIFREGTITKILN
jgi:hypothetical protein